MTRGAKAQSGWTAEEVESAKRLMPFLQAARIGLARSRWRPGDEPDDLLAPIVLAVLVEVSKQLRVSELLTEVT